LPGEQDDLLDRFGVLTGWRAICDYLTAEAGHVQLVPSDLSPQDLPMYTVAGTPMTTRGYLRAWLERRLPKDGAGPAGRMLAWNPELNRMLNRAAYVLRSHGLIDAVDGAGTIRHFLDVLGRQGFESDTRAETGHCLLLSTSSQAFALVVVTPSPAPLREGDQRRFDRTGDDCIIVPAWWIWTKVEMLAGNTRALRILRDLARGLLGAR